MPGDKKSTKGGDKFFVCLDSLDFEGCKKKKDANAAEGIVRERKGTRMIRKQQSG